MNGALPILAPREQEEPCRGTREDQTRGRAGKKNRQAQSSRKGRVNNSTTTEGNTNIKSDAGGESAETPLATDGLTNSGKRRMDQDKGNFREDRDTAMRRGTEVRIDAIFRLFFLDFQNILKISDPP